MGDTCLGRAALFVDWFIAIGLLVKQPRIGILMQMLVPKVGRSGCNEPRGAGDDEMDEKPEVEVNQPLEEDRHEDCGKLHSCSKSDSSSTIKETIYKESS